MTDSKVEIAALLVATFFVGNRELNCKLLHEHNYTHQILSKSRLDHRLYMLLTEILVEHANHNNLIGGYIVEN